MKKTKIDWADSTWNPVTGCLHGCEYCYARKIAERFGGAWRPDDEPIDKSWRLGVPGDTVLMGDYANHANGGLHVLDDVFYSYPCYPTVKPHESDPSRKKAPYPYYFDPTFHRYKLDEPQRWTKPRTIFVCSMADLFGNWVPDEWIEAVINACLAAPQHRYLFLTKNPARYMHLIANGIITENQPNFWFGSTATIPEMEFFWHDEVNTFVSIEPILAPFKDLTDEGIYPSSKTNWIIVGAETGNRKNKVVPQKSWIDEIASAAKKAGTPVFMKESLREIMGDDFRQEFPWKNTEERSDHDEHAHGSAAQDGGGESSAGDLRHE